MRVFYKDRFFPNLVLRCLSASVRGSRGGGPAGFDSLRSALALLVLRVLADNHDTALALDDLALFADGLHGRSHFHVDITSYLHRIAPAVQPCG